MGNLNQQVVTEKDRPVGFTATLTVQVTDQMIRKFADLSGDDNPVHLDDEYAKTTRFGQRIAHGMIVAALISRGLTEKIGTGGIYLGQTLKFVAPVYVNDTLNIKFKVTAVKEGKGILTLETIATKTTGEDVVRGEATFMLGAVA